MTERICALVLAGPSGGGKTTVMNELVGSDYGFELVRSATTREKRGDGNDGEYIYLSKDEFSGQIKAGKMLEFTEYGGNLYGTPHSEIERIVKEDKIPLLIKKEMFDIGDNAHVTFKNLKITADRFVVFKQTTAGASASLTLDAGAHVTNYDLAVDNDIMIYNPNNANANITVNIKVTIWQKSRSLFLFIHPDRQAFFQ